MWIKETGQQFLKENTGVGVSLVESTNLLKKFIDFIEQSQVIYFSHLFEWKYIRLMFI